MNGISPKKSHVPKIWVSAYCESVPPLVLLIRAPRTIESSLPIRGCAARGDATPIQSRRVLSFLSFTVSVEWAAFQITCGANRDTKIPSLAPSFPIPCPNPIKTVKSKVVKARTRSNHAAKSSRCYHFGSFKKSEGKFECPSTESEAKIFS